MTNLVCGRFCPDPLGIVLWFDKLEFAEVSTPRTTLSFRTSAHTGVGISIEFRVSYRHTDRSFAPFSGICPRGMVLLSRRLPRQFENWLAMTGNSPNSNLSNHRTIPSGAGQKRLHIFRARLGRPPCGQIPIYLVVTSGCFVFYIIEQAFENVKWKKKELPQAFLMGKSAEKSSGRERYLLFTPQSAIMATGILKRKRNLYA